MKLILKKLLSILIATFGIMLLMGFVISMLSFNAQSFFAAESVTEIIKQSMPIIMGAIGVVFFIVGRRLFPKNNNLKTQK